MSNQPQRLAPMVGLPIPTQPVSNLCISVPDYNDEEFAKMFDELQEQIISAEGREIIWVLSRNLLELIQKRIIFVALSWLNIEDIQKDMVFTSIMIVLEYMREPIGTKDRFVPLVDVIPPLNPLLVKKLLDVGLLTKPPRDLGEVYLQRVTTRNAAHVLARGRDVVVYTFTPFDIDPYRCIHFIHSEAFTATINFSSREADKQRTPEDDLLQISFTQAWIEALVAEVIGYKVIKEKKITI